MSEDTVRKEFEAWAAKEYEGRLPVGFHRNLDAYYADRRIEDSWQSWQAAYFSGRSAMAKEAAQMVEDAQVPESFRKTKIYTEFERGGDNYLKMMADSLAKKEKV